MTPERLAQIKSKPHGPDVAALIAEVERLWKQNATLIACATQLLDEVKELDDLLVTGGRNLIEHHRQAAKVIPIGRSAR